MNRTSALTLLAESKPILADRYGVTRLARFVLPSVTPPTPPVTAVCHGATRSSRMTLSSPARRWAPWSTNIPVIAL